MRTFAALLAALLAAGCSEEVLRAPSPASALAAIAVYFAGVGYLMRER